MSQSSLLFRIFCAATRNELRWKGRLTPSGRLIMWGTIISGISVSPLLLTQTHQIFILLITLLIIAFIFSSWRFKNHIALIREIPRHATVEQKLEYTVNLINQTKLNQDNLRLVETIPKVYLTWAEFIYGYEPGEENRNWYDRKVGFYRYIWLLRKKRGFYSKPVTVPRISIGSTHRIALSLIPQRRGRIELSGLTLLRPDPFGLVFARQNYLLPASLLVIPKRYPLPAGFKLSGNRHHQPGGVQMASAVGESEEFISLREYRDGDSLRRIYWPGLARHNKLLVREYQEEFFTRHGLILDTFATAADYELFEEAVSLAASFAGLIESGDALLDLLFIGDKSYHFTAGRGVAHLEQILEILACVEINLHDKFDSLTSLVLSQPAILSACVVILLEWNEMRAQLIRQLDMLNLPLLILVVTKSTETLTPASSLTNSASQIKMVPLGQASTILASLTT